VKTGLTVPPLRQSSKEEEEEKHHVWKIAGSLGYCSTRMGKCSRRNV
jgi:hypothetical protein